MVLKGMTSFEEVYNTRFRNIKQKMLFDVICEHLFIRLVRLCKTV